jgi:hypothetical protein
MFGGWLIEELNVLMVVDLDEGDANVFAVFLGEGILLVETKKVVPERDGLRKIGDKIAHMRDAGDPRAHRTCILCKKGSGKQQSNR